VVAPQDAPSVVRVHACDSVVEAAWHAPDPSHTWSVRVRDCVPLVAHVELALQALQGPYVV
jgi:hypothetical protein